MEPYAANNSIVEATVSLHPARHSSFKLGSRSPSLSRKSSPPYGPRFVAHSRFSNTRIICDVVNTVMTIFGIQLIDRVGRRRLLIIGAAGMLICEFIIAIVGVTAGHPVQTASGVAVNLAAQRVLIAFTCMLVVLCRYDTGSSTFYAVTLPSTPSLGVLLFGCLRERFS